MRASVRKPVRRFNRSRAGGRDEVEWTALTLTTVCVLFGMIGLVSGVLVGNLGGRNFSKYIVPTAILIMIVIPWILFYSLGQVIVIYEPINDWGGSGALGWGSPTWLPLIGTIAGGFFGGYSGFQWSEFGDTSCFRCLMAPVLLVFALSVVMVLL